jgi:RNA-binding protein
MIELRGKQLTFLRGLAHHLNVVVSVGNRGVTRAVVDELNEALRVHELVKVKLAGEDRNTRQMCLERLCAATDAQAVQQIGKTGILYRPAREPRIKLPA